MHLSPRPHALSRRSRRALTSAVLAAIATIAPLSAVRANVTSWDLFKTGFYTQTSASQVTPTISYFFAADININTPGDIGTATLSYPLPTSTTQSLSPNGSFQYHYSSPVFATAADLNAALPNNQNLVYSISGGTLGSDAHALTNPSNSDYFPISTPLFSAATYTGLQGMNSAQNFTVSWNSFQPSSTSNTDLIFFSVLDSTGATVFNAPGLAQSTTSLTIPAGTLQAGQSYTASLFFSDRFTIPNAGFGANAIYSYDYNVLAQFTTAASNIGTAAPEPGALALIGVTCGGMLPLLGLRHRRSA